MSLKPNGELVPLGGGEVIPLERESMLVGRRESCDICLKFPNVSSVHCEFSFANGYWMLQDKGSTNGVKVNGTRISFKKRLMPGDEIGIAKMKYTLKYELPANRRMDDILDMEEEDIMGQSLLERAGLTKSRGMDDSDLEGEQAPRQPVRRRR